MCLPAIDTYQTTRIFQFLADRKQSRTDQVDRQLESHLFYEDSPNH